MPQSLIPIVANPASGGGKGRKIVGALEEALRARGYPFRTYLTRGPGQAGGLALEAVASGAEALLVVGGDGTVHEVANGLVGSQASDGPPGAQRLPPMALVPVGTGNDFHRMVGSAKGAAAAVDLLARGRAVPFEVGRAHWPGGSRYFVNLAGVGVDVEVLKRRAAFSHLPGLSQYLAALLSAVTRFRPAAFRMEVGHDGEVMEHATLLTAVTVGPSVGGGFLLSPDARPDDGLLDFFSAEDLSLPRLARYIPKVIRGTHASVEGIHMRQVTRVRISSADDTPFYFELDGELMPHAVPWLEIQVQPAALPVLVPEGRP
ncbi:MAG: diacylglycerol kinase family protein [Gemmatimonadota bacterium]